MEGGISLNDDSANGLAPELSSETANSKTLGFVRPPAVSPMKIRRKRRRKCARLHTKRERDRRGSRYSLHGEEVERSCPRQSSLSVRRALYLPRNESSLCFQAGQVLITHS